MLGYIKFLIIDAVLDTTGKLKVEACREYDNVGIQLFARFELNTVAVELINVISHHLGIPGAYCGKKIAIGYRTQTLIPRIVIRGKVSGDVIVGA